LPVAARAAVVEATMPTMLMAILLADRFRLDNEAAALMIGWSTMLFWLTLPAWLWLME
jgi:predicted permease